VTCIKGIKLGLGRSGLMAFYTDEQIQNESTRLAVLFQRILKAECEIPEALHAGIFLEVSKAISCRLTRINSEYSKEELVTMIEEEEYSLG
jgi:hypothetical protein